ncbi:hypothetical protein [Streptomyces sp. cg40]|uniref:hypothetical protein n=1 Tax=Streptomyces sp. cg40 TaxID=3419764 RepID=UPI003D08E872
MNKKVSDLSKKEGDDGDFVVVVVRQHPTLDEPKALDVLPDELEKFVPIGDLVMLEIQQPDGTKKDVAMRLADFNKLAPNMDQVLKEARKTRGRVPGTRVGNGNG